MKIEKRNFMEKSNLIVMTEAEAKSGKEKNHGTSFERTKLHY